jgi:hypothetical protein
MQLIVLGGQFNILEKNMITKAIHKLIRQSKKSEDFSELTALLDSKLLLLRDSVICAFDIEFTDNSCKHISEIGYVLYNPADHGEDGILTTESVHFIIEEQVGEYVRRSTPIAHSEMFAYGTSEVLPLDEALAQLKKALMRADTCWLYASNGKREQLDKAGMEGIEFNSVQSLLTLKRRDGNAVAMAKAISVIDTIEQPINNAGNDAVSTLQILNIEFEVGVREMIDGFPHVIIDVPIVNDFSADPRKRSAMGIQANRQSLNLQDRQTG